VRRLVLAALFGAALVLVASAYSSAGDPTKRLNARDQAYAKTIPLRQAELPGGAVWSAGATNFNQANPACVVKDYNLSSLTATGQAGFTYTHTQLDRIVESNARVFVTAAESARALSVFTSVGLGRCLASSTAADLSSSTPTLHVAVTHVGSLALRGLAAAARGTTFELRLRGSENVTSLHYVFLSIRRGRALATLGLARYNQRWSTSEIRPLAALVAERMTKP